MGDLNSKVLTFSTPFQLRKRGVETKLVIGAEPMKAVDATLICSIAKAHQYYEAICNPSRPLRQMKLFC